MIKRVMLAVLLSAAIVAPTTGAQAAQVTVYRTIGGFYNTFPNIVSVFGFVQQDLVGNTQSAYAQVYVQTANGTDSGAGVLDVVLDPTGTVGRLSGTIQGNSGPITIDATYLSLTVATNFPPGAYFYKTPGEPEFFGTYYWNRVTGELPTASVTSGVGNVDASGAFAQAAFQLSLTAP
jgi:hypothetical protein